MNFANKTNSKIETPDKCEIWTNFGKSNPKIWPSFKYINLSRVQRLCKKKYSAIKNSLWPSFGGFTNALYSKKWSKPFSLVKTVISAPPNEKSRFFKIKNLRNFWNFQPCSVFSKKQTYVSKGINLEDWGGCEILGTTQTCRQGESTLTQGTHILDQTYVIYYQFFPYN